MSRDLPRFVSWSSLVTEPTELTIADAADTIARGELSPVELTRAYLARIDKLDPELNA